MNHIIMELIIRERHEEMIEEARQTGIYPGGVSSAYEKAMLKIAGFLMCTGERLRQKHCPEAKTRLRKA